MAFDSFMGAMGNLNDFQGNGYVSDNTNLGNTEMADFQTDDSAMDIVNLPEIKEEFGLAGIQQQAVNLQHPDIGDMNATTSEFWGYGALFFGVGVLATILFNRVR